MKDNLIKFLKAKQTTFTVNEINQIIAIVENLEEKQAEKKPKK